MYGKNIMWNMFAVMMYTGRASWGKKVMKLLFKQRLFSWLDSYDIHNEDGDVVYTVEGQISIGKCLDVIDRAGNHVATIKRKLFTFLPCFDIYIQGEFVGCVKKKFSLFYPSFTVDYRGWSVDGDFLEWDYSITDKDGLKVADISKIIFKLSDTYCIEVSDMFNALDILILVLAIDAEKVSR